jgi:hypothetical protein
MKIKKMIFEQKRDETKTMVYSKSRQPKVFLDTLRHVVHREPVAFLDLGRGDEERSLDAVDLEPASRVKFKPPVWNEITCIRSAGATNKATWKEGAPLDGPVSFVG